MGVRLESIQRGPAGLPSARYWEVAALIKLLSGKNKNSGPSAVKPMPYSLNLGEKNRILLLTLQCLLL